MSGISRQRFGRTIITSIHQPSAEVFNLFHSLCLMSSGRTVYFGPASAAIEFFGTNGFSCPTLQNPSDHFLKTINEDFDEGGEILEKRSHANFTTQSLVLTKRSSMNMFRDLGYYWMRFAMYIALSLALGSIYYDVGSSSHSIEESGMMLAFVVSFMTFMAIGGFPSFVEDMKVFQRENLNGHYGCVAFVISNTLSSTPYLLLISLVPGAIAYFLAGFQNGFGHFIYFTLALFTCMMIVESLMMKVAVIVPNFLIGIVIGAAIEGLMILSGGFFQLPNELPKLIWKYPLYYISFQKYAYQGMFKNEFEGLYFADHLNGNNQTISGEDVLRYRWQVEMEYSKWVDLAILVGTLILCRLMFCLIIMTNEKGVHLVKGSISNLSNRSIQIVAKYSPLHGLTSSSEIPTNIV